MGTGLHYVLDSDSLIRSKNEHYANDICPGFWDALLRGFDSGQLCSVIPVRDEVLRGKDALAGWVKDNSPKSFFADVDTSAVVTAYAEVVDLVQQNGDYITAAKQKFLAGADPWLVAFAKTNEFNIVTYEVPSPESRSQVKLPDVARHFRIQCVRPYAMLRRIGAKLVLE